MTSPGLNHSSSGSIEPELLREPQADTYARIFSALSEPIRIDIVSMIEGTAELACTVLDETLPISKSTISYHVKILHHADLIQVRKEGRYYFYRLKAETFDHYLPGFLPRVRKRSRSKRRNAPEAAALAR